MPYYVPLGVRGLIMNLGTHLIGSLGGLRYRSARRGHARRNAEPIPKPHFRVEPTGPAQPERAATAAPGRAND